MSEPETSVLNLSLRPPLVFILPRAATHVPCFVERVIYVLLWALFLFFVCFCSAAHHQGVADGGQRHRRRRAAGHVDLCC